MSIPANHMKSWTAEDLNCVKVLFYKGHPVKYIANHLGRTNVSIRCKLESLGLVEEFKDYSPTPQVTAQPIKEKAMSFTIKVENKTFINGVDVATMSNEDFFALIVTAEAEVERMDKVQNKPKVLVKMKEDLVLGIMALVNLVDARG